ncbi:hypothetical protein ACFL6S_20015 [Candidatus Poribacteria bacterium]
MLSNEYLAKGITGLARAIDYSWAQGHFGCAVIATYFLCAENELRDSTVEGLKVELDKMIESRAHLVVPIEPTDSNAELLREIPEALGGNISELRPGGHNVIYASLALKALKRMPEMITLEIIDGIRRLIEVFSDMPLQNDSHGIDVTELSADLDDAVPRYSDDEMIAEFTFSEVLKFAEMYYEIQGVVGHLLDHAQSLVELSRMGYPDLARRGYDAHRLHIRRVRLFPDCFDKSIWMPVRPVHNDPLDPSFWEKDVEAMAKSSWGYAHFFKYRYHFYDLVKLVRSPGLKAKCLERMAYYIMNDFRNQDKRPEEFIIPLPDCKEKSSSR